MPLAFAYGSNMDVNAMARRCPRSRPLGAARLARFRLAVMREGWLTVVRAPAATVHGLLWDIALADVAALDRYESLGTGLYTKAIAPVVTKDGPRRALLYVGANAGPGTPAPDYIAGVIAAARACGLPAEALAALEGLGPAATRGLGGGSQRSI